MTFHCLSSASPTLLLGKPGEGRCSVAAPAALPQLACPPGGPTFATCAPLAALRSTRKWNTCPATTATFARSATASKRRTRGSA